MGARMNVEVFKGIVPMSLKNLGVTYPATKFPEEPST